METQRLTRFDVADLHNASQTEDNPQPLIELAVDQSMPKDIRRNAAERLNDIRGAALGFIRCCNDRVLIGKMARSGYFANDFLTFAKARLTALGESEAEKPALDKSPEQAKLDRIAELERDNEALRQRKAKPTMSRGNKEEQAEALQRAQNCHSIANMATVTTEFSKRGIALDDIKPGENVLTFKAWIALGRVVKRGEHGVKVNTVIACSKEDEDGDKHSFKRPWRATVFHISQTEVL